jgi:hypothetical protein
VGIVAAVGLFSGGDSYSHIFSLARDHHQDIVSAALLPLAGDGVVIASSWVMLAAAKKNEPVPLRARLTFWGGVAATLAANGAYGLPHGLASALLSLWPVAAYLGCMEMLTWMQQHLWTHPAAKPKKSKSTSEVPHLDAPETPELDAPGDELAGRRKNRKRESLEALLARAERQYPGGRNSIGKIPGLRDIQDDLKVGQPKAQEVQRHFRQLQPA